MQGFGISDGGGRMARRSLEWGPGVCLEDLDDKLGLHPRSFGTSPVDFMQGSDMMHFS